MSNQNEPSNLSNPNIAQMVCDFCQAPCPKWEYSASPYSTLVLGEKLHTGDIVSSPILESDSGWMACQACKQIIESGDRRALAERAVNSVYMEKSEARHALLVGLVLDFHEPFWQSKSEAKEVG